MFLRVLIAWSALAASLAHGEETSTPATVDALNRVEDALEVDEQMAVETKDALRDLVRALKSEVTAPETPEDAPSGEESRWARFASRLTPYGDFRLRHESSFAQDSRSDRHRLRLRFRLGATYRISDEITAGVRIVTGDADDPNSPHATIGDVFDNLEISLDRAFISYRPQSLAGFFVTAGKFAHPFETNPVYGELLWDADVHPEGLALGYARVEGGVLDELRLVAGWYILEERATRTDAFSARRSSIGRAATD